MFQRKRQLKKDKSKKKVKFFFKALFFLIVILLIFEYLYFNFSFSFSLGKITYISPLSKNKVSNTVLLSEKLEKKNISFTSVTASSDASLVVKLKEGSVVILSSKKDIESQISSLQLILSRLTIEGKKLKVLDFRYDSPVVSF